MSLSTAVSKFGLPRTWGDANKRNVTKVSQGTTLASPIGGLNSRDSIANMDPTDAIVLTNWFPNTLGCTVRNGYSVYAYGATGNVETVANHRRTASEKLYAFAGGSMYDITAGGNIAALTPLVTGLLSNRWEWMNYPTSGGVFWIGVSAGGDNPIIIDNSGTVRRLVQGNGTDPYTIANVDPSTFTNVTMHQKRIWFIGTNSTAAWYLPVNQVYGAALSFDFGPLMQRGGTLVKQIAWTVDAGDGPGDRLAIISTAGEVLIYTGTDVNTVGAWALSGVFYVGAPVGRRCAVRFAGDVAIITVNGLASLSACLTSTTVNSRNTFFSDKISTTISDLLFSKFSSFGWEPFIYPAQNMLLLNVPDIGGNYQLAMNTESGAWTTFIGMQAQSWTLFGIGTMYGGSGKVYAGLSGTLDGVDAFSSNNGSDIVCEAITAYSYFQSSGTEKMFEMVRPTFIGVNPPQISVKVNTDFDYTSAPDPVNGATINTALWDVAIWDQAVWGGTRRTFKDWYGAGAMGYAGALAMKIKARDQLMWASTDWIVQVQQGNYL